MCAMKGCLKTGIMLMWSIKMCDGVEKNEERSVPHEIHEADFSQSSKSGAENRLREA
jgi:hypothetical protein